MSDHRILKNGELVPADLMEWARWFEKSEERRIGLDVIGDVKVSTVCLGVAYEFGDNPMWFETLIFGGPHDQYEEHYATLAEAKAGHAKAVALVHGDAE